MYVLNFFTQEYGMSFLFFLIGQQTIAHWPDLATPIHLHIVYSCFHASTAVEQSIHSCYRDHMCYKVQNIILTFTEKFYKYLAYIIIYVPE